MANITKQIPFNFKKALKGAKVVTRDGHRVSVSSIKNGNIIYPVRACIYARPFTDEVDLSELFTEKGHFFANGDKHPYDLFIEVKEDVKEAVEVVKDVTKELTTIAITDERKQYLEYIGLSSSSDVRSKNAGKSDYSKQVIQPWTIWHASPNITTIDKDIIKRTLRSKEEGNMSPINSRILDYEKIIHDCQERIRQLKVLLETSLPFINFKTEDDELINKQLKYYELNDK